jgi:predicted transcriptional regulator
LELTAQGYNTVEIAEMLGVSRPLISLDLQYLREQAKENIKLYVDEKLPSEYEKCLVGLKTILTEAWKIAKNSTDGREKVQALSLAKDCYSKIEDLLTSVGAVSDAMKFVEDVKSKRIMSFKLEPQEIDETNNEPRSGKQSVF